MFVLYYHGGLQLKWLIILKRVSGGERYFCIFVEGNGCCKEGDFVENGQEIWPSAEIGLLSQEGREEKVAKKM